MRHHGTTTRMFEKDFSGERIFIVTALLASIIIGALIFSFTKNYYEEMSKMIIEGHCHGSIHAHNENEYAVFTIKLPLENEE